MSPAQSCPLRVTPISPFTPCTPLEHSDNLSFLFVYVCIPHPPPSDYKLQRTIDVVFRTNWTVCNVGEAINLRYTFIIDFLINTIYSCIWLDGDSCQNLKIMLFWDCVFPSRGRALQSYAINTGPGNYKEGKQDVFILRTNSRSTGFNNQNHIFNCSVVWLRGCDMAKWMGQHPVTLATECEMNPAARLCQSAHCVGWARGATEEDRGDPVIKGWEGAILGANAFYI